MANIDDRWTSPGTNSRRVMNARHGSGSRWRARSYDADARQHARHIDRKVDAQRWLDSVTTAVGTGPYVPWPALFPWLTVLDRDTLVRVVWGGRDSNPRPEDYEACCP